MPSTGPEDDDPIVASYQVYLTSPAVGDEGKTGSRLYLLQYPAHRPSSRPYNAANSQKPAALKVKPQSGQLELEIPMLTHENYNSETGHTYHKALRSSRVAAEGGTHGLAGGFNTTSSGLLQFQTLNDVPSHSGDESEPGEELQYQTLGGKIKPPSPGDPIYMLGSFHDEALHLSPLDAVTQMRPQLHHVDAQDEIDRKRTYLANAAGTTKAKPNLEVGPPKIETKAIDIKVKNANDDGRDRGINANAKLLRDIQAEQWQSHNWVDESEDASTAKFIANLHYADPESATQLKSKLSNSEWLDKMSAPREAGHGKKGLLAKLRGRERERARRKKNEEEKARKAQEQAAKGEPVVQGGLEQDADTDDSELTDLTESEEDVEMIDMTVDVEVKEEPEQSIVPPQPPTPVKKTRAPTETAAQKHSHDC